MCARTRLSISMACSSPTSETTPKLSGWPAPFFLYSGCSIAAGAGNPMRDGVRPQMDSARVAQRLDAAVVGNHVAKLDDLRNTPEMFDETSRAAEGLACQIVDGDLPVVQIGVGDSPEVLEDEVLNHAQVLPDGRRAHLLVVANNEHRLAQVQGDQCHH